MMEKLLQGEYLMKLSEYLRSIKQMKSWRSLVILCVGFALGIILDAIVEVTGWAFIYVSSDYINEAFGAACSVAVLGNAILSLLVGASERDIKGIPFQDVLHFTKFGSDQQLTIIATTFSIIFAIFAYSKGLCTTVTFLVCLDAFLILSSSIDLWKILSDEEKQMEIINEIIDDDKLARSDVYVENWFENLNHALDSYNESTIQEFCDLISKISATSVETKNPINTAIARYLPPLFEAACEKIGFVDAYKLINRINKIRPDGFVDCESTARDYIKSLKYCNAMNVHNRSIPTVVESIIEKMDAEEWVKTSFTYNYFCAIFDNAYLSPDAKHDLLVGLLDILTYLRDGNGGKVKKDVLLYMVKYDVILNGNDENRTMLFALLTESLLRNNRYVEDSVFVGTIAEVFRAFYFYIYCEKETLTEEYRHDLLNLYQYQQSKKDLIALSFGYLIKENYEKISFWLAEDAVIFDRNRRCIWDYFGPTTRAKSLVWSSSETIRFAYCFYKLIGYAHSGNPFIQIMDSDKYEDYEKIAMCRVITNLYDNGELNDKAKETLSRLEELTGIRGHRSSLRDKPEHDYFQERLTDYLAKNNQEALEQEALSNKKIIQLVNQELEKGNTFALDSELRLSPSTRRRIEPTLIEINKHYAEHSAYRIAQLIRIIMNDVIAQKLRRVSIDFGQRGIRTLLENLQSNDWGYRNYIHINDYAIPPTVRETEEFSSLCKIINGIKYDSSHEITPYVFLKAVKVPYNISIRYHLEEPDEEKCADFVKRHQIADGVYQIASNRFDFSHAMKYVRHNYKLEIVDVTVRVDIDADSGFQIEFERSK